MNTMAYRAWPVGVADRHVVLLAVAWAAIGLMFAGDLAGLATIWWTSSTFNHCLLIPPIIAWLIWQRWSELRTLTPRAWLPGLLVIAVGGVGWLLGDAAGVGLARHLGLILMLQGSVIAILGPDVSRGIMFPLAYMLFLVPMGEGLVPPLQTLTAKICMGLLDFVGIPAHIEGVFITIPNGWFEIAEACSGVKFLIAMAAYGVLVANVCFRSWMRRTAFVAAALILPVLANGVRAWGTIYVAHRTNAHFAEGFDHVFYGWIFFGAVIVVLMGAGWRWFDRKVDDPWIDASALSRPHILSDQLGLAFAASLLIPFTAIAWSMAASSGAAALPSDTRLPQISGWSLISPSRDWTPHFKGADRFVVGRYVDPAGRKVDLAIAVYAYQMEGRELVGYGQGAVSPGSRWAWTDDQPPPVGGRAFRITGLGGVVRDVVTFYRVGDVTTGSELRVKIETLKSKLTGGRKRAVAIIVSAIEPGDGENARPVVNAFLKAMGPVDRLADRLSSPGS
jgi:exosortase A